MDALMDPARSAAITTTLFRNKFFYAIVIFTLISSILATLAVNAGKTANFFQDVAILTIDTSSVAAAVQRYLKSSAPITGIPDWIEVHYLSVCYGLWSGSSASNGRDASTTVCEAHSAGYTFSLAAELAAVAPASAAALFANWPSAYGVLPTATFFGLLVASIVLGFISVLCYIVSVFIARRGSPLLSLNMLRAAFLFGVVYAILCTNSAAQVTAKSHKLVGVSPSDVPVLVNIWMQKGLYNFLWVGVGLSWLAVAISIFLSFAVARIIMNHKVEDHVVG